jgi:hypothetical protein
VVGDFDVIVGCDATLLPLGILVRRGRKRLQCRPIDLREQLVAAHSEFAHDLGVEVADARMDRRIEFSEREEAGIAQSRQHEPLDNLHRHFDLGLGESRQMQMVWKRRHTQRSVSRTLFIPTTVAGLN